MAADHLRAQGYTIVATNVRIGRLELDVIARRGDRIVVCEVRARSSNAIAWPAETVDAKKRERVRRATIGWLQRERIAAREVRFDVAAYLLAPNAEPRLDYYENCF